MTRCLACNGILKEGETVCYACGDGVSKDVNKTHWSKRVSAMITLTFIASLGLTGFSFFSDRTPPFTVCLAVSVILLFVKRSADQLRERRT